MSAPATARAGLATAALLGWACLQVPGCSMPTGIADSNSPGPPDGNGPRPDASGDAAVPAGDSLPTGAISLFNRKSCPGGWGPLAVAAGRTLVPTVGAHPPGTTAGQPLDDGEERRHTHGLTAALSLPSVTYAGVVGEANHGVARAGSVPLTVVGSSASSGLPYVQLLVCQKQAAADPAQRPPRTGLLMFFPTADCPPGWGQAGSTQGHILIGVPEGATPGQKFGGPALTAGERRTHHHRFAGAITTSGYGIALLSGGAAGGYAQNDRHPYDGTTDDKEADVPYLQLLQCQKL